MVIGNLQCSFDTENPINTDHCEMNILQWWFVINRDNVFQTFFNKNFKT